MKWSIESMVTKKNFMEFAIGRAEHEHAELSEAWKLLDTKAQATTAIAGVFVAASFAFVRNSAFHPSFYEKILLGLTVAALVISIYFALSAMRIRQVPMPITGIETLQDVIAIFKKHTLPESLDNRYNGLLEDSITKWGCVNSSLSSSLICKSKSLARSHGSLMIAALLILLLTITSLCNVEQLNCLK